jgi:hypothetical protein
MNISLKTQKMLWGRAASRCSYPSCRIELVIDASETDDESLIGDVCHIVAVEPNGPRGNSSLTSDQRDKYENLILLCKVHHKLIDDQFIEYNVEKLKMMKMAHEQWVHESLTGYDAAKQKDDEYYAWLIEEWSERAEIDDWLNWSSFILYSSQPRMYSDLDKKLEELRYWLFSRIWPKRYPDLEAAFENFRRVLSDFHVEFRRHAQRVGEEKELLLTEKFYKIKEWDKERYDHLVKCYDYHVSLVEDLMLELTRAANYLCDKVRQFIFPSFRLEEGLLLVESGPYVDKGMVFRTLRVEYRRDERVKYPYPGLEKFKIERVKRDLNFGEGREPADF